MNNILSTIKYVNYSRLTRRNGINGLHIILSYDCDRPNDAVSAETVSKQLKQNNIPAVFAVPGKRIEAHANIYRKIRSRGFEFINHGYRDHTIYSPKNRTFKPGTWYETMSEAEIRQDITKGDLTIKKYLGMKPLGFRAPHFGTIPDDLMQKVYSTISGLGYSYASTTVPNNGLDKGAVYKALGSLYEFPLSGTFDNPQTILDSWSFMAAPDKVFKSSDYVIQFTKMLDFFKHYRLPCILNYYTDPSHIVNYEEYFKLIEKAVNSGYQFTTYSNILKTI